MKLASISFILRVFYDTGACAHRILSLSWLYIMHDARELCVKTTKISKLRIAYNG